MPIVYLIFILLAAYFSFRYDGIEEYDQHKSHRFWLLCAYLICLAGFSYALGGDKQSYLHLFEIMNPELSFSESLYYGLLFQGYMPGWMSFMLLAKRVFDSFYAVQIIHAIVVNVCICLIVQRYTHRCFMFFLLYFMWTYFIFNTEVMREALAICCSMFAMEAYMDGKKMTFAALVPLAILFHVSAIVVLIFPFLKFGIRWKTLLIAFAISFIFWFLSGVILSKVILSVLGTAGALAQKIERHGMIASTFFGFVRNVTTNLILPFIIMYFSYQWEPSDKFKIRKQKIISYFLVLGIIAGAIGPMARLRNYIEIYYLAMFADFAYMLFRVKKHLIIRVGTVLLTLFLVFLNQANYISETNTWFYEYYVPYTSIFDEDKDIADLRSQMHAVTSTTKGTDKNTREIKE